jgi:hypothetical protein
MIRRTWRWHQLLKGDRDGRLKPEAQKGLIGELDFLGNVVLAQFSPAEAMAFWEGPAGLPKDFVIADTSVEVKARRGAARPVVSISSEHQLDHAGFEHLFLYVVDLAPASHSDEDSFSLDDYVDRTYKIIHEIDPGAVEIFETKLLEAGYMTEDDYSDKYWIRLGAQSFEVKGDFPRVIDSELPPGVIDVNYKIDLGDLEPYKVDQEILEAAFTGDKDE